MKRKLDKALERISPNDLKDARSCTQMQIVQNLTEKEARIISKFPPGTLQFVMEKMGIPEE